ncbi:MAG: alpha/beta hydrolase [Coriobacteriales bacterium]|nr:alpha/beta hydrolase [Coriobacteriales bacterium]
MENNKPVPDSKALSYSHVIRLITTLIILLVIAIISFVNGKIILGIIAAVLFVAMLAGCYLIGSYLVKDTLAKGSNVFLTAIQKPRGRIASAITLIDTVKNSGGNIETILEAVAKKDHECDQNQAEAIEQDNSEFEESLSLVPFAPIDDLFMAQMTESQKEHVMSERAQERKKVRMWMENASQWKTVSIQSSDGLTLKARLIERHPDTEKWVILVHGYAGSWTELYHHARVYDEHGYNVLLPNMRAHASSEGSLISMGFHEGKDLALWAQFLNKTYSENDLHIVLHGQSMGAANVCNAAALEDLPSSVVAGICDCSFSHSTQAVAWMCDMLVPGIPLHPTLELFDCNLRLRKGGCSIMQSDPACAVAKSNIPLMFIHAAQDTIVDPLCSQELYDAANVKKELLVIEGSGHCLNSFANKEEYYKRVFDFIK